MKWLSVVVVMGKLFVGVLVLSTLALYWVAILELEARMTVIEDVHWETE